MASRLLQLLQWDLHISVGVQPPILQFGKIFDKHIFVRLMDVKAIFFSNLNDIAFSESISNRRSEFKSNPAF